jgi:hypothetical protein
MAIAEKASEVVVRKMRAGGDGATGDGAAALSDAHPGAVTAPIEAKFPDPSL